jgi:hypothetical protein
MDILFRGLLLWTQQYISMCIKVVQATISFSRSTLHYGILGYFKFWNILKWLISSYIITVFWVLCHALAFSSICIYFWANSLPSCLLFMLFILPSQINEHMIQTQIMGLRHCVVLYQHFRGTYCLHLQGWILWRGRQYMRFEVLTAVNMKTAVFWAVSLFSLVERY